eukprot:gene30725-35755_t
MCIALRADLNYDLCGKELSPGKEYCEKAECKKFLLPSCRTPCHLTAGESRDSSDALTFAEAKAVFEDN